MSLITYIRGTVFLIFLITKTSSEQLAVYPLAGMFFYFDILKWSPLEIYDLYHSN